MADVAAARAKVLRDIDELTRFAADYLGALQRHLYHQGQSIDGAGGQ
jgi:hypothetical protein